MVQHSQLSDAERLRMLRVLDRIAARPITRGETDVRAELREIRRNRQAAYPRAWERTGN